MPLGMAGTGSRLRRDLAPHDRLNTARTKCRKSLSWDVRRTNIVARDKPVASHADAGQGADPETGATVESALWWRRCRNSRIAASTDSCGGQRGRRRVDGCEFRARRYRDSARGAHRKGEASPAPGGAVDDSRGPGSATTGLASVRGPSLFLHGPAHISILSDYASTSARRSVAMVSE